MAHEQRDFDSRTAIVTGGGGSIGAAISVELARRGANVVIAQRSEDPATTVVDRIDEVGGDGMFVPTDVSKRTDVETLVSATAERFGSVDIIVNNAAHPGKQPAASMERSEWESIVATNLTGPFQLAQACVPHMRERGYGRIVNIGAIQAYSPLPGAVGYASAKAGLEGLTRSLAAEWSGDGITTNTVHVGAIYSADWVPDDERVPADAPVERRYETVPDDLDDSAATLVERLGTPREVAALTAFLAGERAGFVTGQVLFCDGGRLISRKSESFDQLDEE